MRRKSLDAVSREENVSVHRLTEWCDKVLTGAESALKEHERDARDDEILRLQAKLGEITMEGRWRFRKSVRGTDFSKNELLYERIGQLEGGRPLVRRRSVK